MRPTRNAVIQVTICAAFLAAAAPPGSSFDPRWRGAIDPLERELGISVPHDGSALREVRLPSRYFLKGVTACGDRDKDGADDFFGRATHWRDYGEDMGRDLAHLVSGRTGRVLARDFDGDGFDEVLLTHRSEGRHGSAGPTGGRPAIRILELSR